ncbi:hypothetical protein MKX03_037734, partial [Papaver bracteatum]
MASTLLKNFLDPKKNWLAGVHKKAIANRLTHYGFVIFLFNRWIFFVQVFDMTIYMIYFMDLDIKEALNRLPVEVVDARNQRLKRARIFVRMDLL